MVRPFSLQMTSRSQAQRIQQLQSQSERAGSHFESLPIQSLKGYWLILHQTNSLILKCVNKQNQQVQFSDYRFSNTNLMNSFRPIIFNKRNLKITCVVSDLHAGYEKIRIPLQSFCTKLKYFNMKWVIYPSLSI